MRTTLHISHHCIPVDSAALVLSLRGNWFYIGFALTLNIGTIPPGFYRLGSIIYVPFIVKLLRDPVWLFPTGSHSVPFTFATSDFHILGLHMPDVLLWHSAAAVALALRAIWPSVHPYILMVLVIYIITNRRINAINYRIPYMIWPYGIFLRV